MHYFLPPNHAQHFADGNPERPERITAIVQGLESAGLWQPYPKLAALPIPQSVLHAIHTPAYLDDLQRACLTHPWYDADTYLTPASWQIALESAGGALAIAEAVWTRQTESGFALCRPPGHHATPHRAMGFCLLNNAALAAEYLIQQHGAQRIAILDLDLHHGNGTQDIFWARGDVLYISTHQSPLYPGTGSVDETGVGAGAGATMNFPLPPGSGDSAFAAVLEEAILPMLNQFKPQMLIISLGFDSHWRDPLGYLLVSAQGYYTTLTRLTEWAQQHANGRIALILEGGYDLQADSACAQAAVSALLAQPFTDPIGAARHPERGAWRSVLDQVKRKFSL